MAFSEQVKLSVKKKAAFRCCRCHEIGIDIHHIVPKSKGGKDDFENAAPLCQNCHDRFGNDPLRRKEIRQMRDWWYDIIAERFSTSALFNQDISKLGFDIQAYIHEHRDVFSNLSRQFSGPRPSTKDAQRRKPRPIFDPAYIDKYITVDGIRDPDAFALEVKGLSMLPRFQNGDLVVVSPKASVRSGDVCVIRVGDEDTLKTVHFDNKLVHLIPTNAEFEPMTVKHSSIKFIYKVVKLISDM